MLSIARVQVKARTRRPRPLVAAVAALVILAVAGLLARSTLMDNGDSDRDPTVSAVCRVAELAGDGQAGEARRVFTNDVHGPLHTLAQEAADAGDRAAAGRLLEAKELIESAPEGPTAADADLLMTATVAAAKAAGRPPGGCT